MFMEASDVFSRFFQRLKELRIEPLTGRVDLICAHFEGRVSQAVELLTVSAESFIPVFSDVGDDIRYGVLHSGGHLRAQEQFVAADFFVFKLTYHLL